MGGVNDVAAVLWDLDGTLVDTEPAWQAAEVELAAEHGRAWTVEDALDLVGSALIDAGHRIRERLGSDLTAEQIVTHLVDWVTRSLHEDIPWMPGVRSLVDALAAEGVPQAVVTMSYRSIADQVAAHLPVSVVVTGDEVTHGKPHPEPYLLAAERLGVDPASCVAIEDSRTGATSANAAGCFVVAVPHLVAVPEAERRTFLPTLDGVTPRDLRALVITS